MTRTTRTTRDLFPKTSITETGVIRLPNNRYSLTLALGDINYHFAAEDRQAQLLANYANWFNSFNPGEHLQISVVTRRKPSQQVTESITHDPTQVPPTGRPVIADYNHIVTAKTVGQGWARVAEKFLTITITAPSQEAATSGLERLAARVAKQLADLLDIHSRRLTALERVQLLTEITRRQTLPTWQPHLALPDLIAPEAVERAGSSALTVYGDTSTYLVRTVRIRDYSTWLDDDLIAKLLDIDTDMTISIHAAPFGKSGTEEVIRVRRKRLRFERTGRQAKLRKNGQDPHEDLPERLKTALRETDDFETDMREHDQQLFNSTVIISIQADTREEADQTVKAIISTVQGRGCAITQEHFGQIPAWTSALPLGINMLATRSLTSANLATHMPFACVDITHPQGLFYGTNPTSGNSIVIDIDQLTSGHQAILGTTGSGKSFLSKILLAQLAAGTRDDIVLIDPEGEYVPFARTFAATSVDVRPDSDQVINPFDITWSSVEGDPIRLKTVDMLRILGALIGDSDGQLDPAEFSILDRCIRDLYVAQSNQSGPAPTFRTLHTHLMAQPEPEAHTLARRLEIYATGSYSGFAQHTNINSHNRILHYNLARLGTAMRLFGMLVVLDQIWQRVLKNFGTGTRTHLFIDEFQLYFSTPAAIDMFRDFYARGRKYGLAVSLMAQNMELILQVPEARSIIANSERLVILDQGPTDAAALVDLLDLSREQARLINGVQPGCGLLKAGPAIVEFDSRIPDTGPLFDMISTRFE